ncbi:MAG: ATP synthase F1 subunit delta [Chloroflexi bacterium]|nr:ATP synthase F1 subunit delta [Chloroflexota bacterium]
MAKQVGGQRYARALFDLAVEKDATDQWATDLAQLADVMQDEQFNLFLKHAEVRLEQKIESLATVLAEIDPMVRNLGSLLITRGSVDTIGDVAVSYNRLVDERLERQRIEVTTAVELEPAEAERIRQFVANLVQREVVMSTQVDESILGGMVIQIGDRLMDGSTRSRLEELRKQIRAEAAAG